MITCRLLGSSGGASPCFRFLLADKAVVVVAKLIRLASYLSMCG